ncbi:Glu/Leu/Phe/Val dehydrogenase [Arenicella sp. 4NH20-0111]|uniref:Leu/Phe/Val dehydrogenase n=1 Tax=Arenicella sp. 4NH20-0111 TaxID=3127648 RepID=UPI0031056F2B
MNFKDSKSFDNHEVVEFCNDPETGLKAIIAVHNTNLGPAVGGCRMYPYADEGQALEDVLRLSRGMTYKSAVAGLPMGGGKAVIIGDPAKDKSPELFERMGKFIESFNGRYVTAEDSGTSVSDLKQVASQTAHVLGVNEAQEFGGDPSPLTAYGVFCGIESAVNYQLGRDNLSGVRVAVQGAGAVGRYLIKLLHEAGAKTSVCDVNLDNLNRARDLGSDIVDVNSIISAEADVFAPCAMGAILNDDSISQLKATIVAGGANNQLAHLSHATTLKNRGILYAPDFVINAGGIIEICRQLHDDPVSETKEKISHIGATLTEIFTQSHASGLTTAQVAERLAEQRFLSKQDSSNVA